MANFKDVVRLGRDAVVRKTGDGKPVASFSAAFDSGFGAKKHGVWLDCSFWGERAEKLAQYLTKGAQVVVEGSLGTREHEGKTYFTLDVSDVRLLAKAKAA